MLFWMIVLGIFLLDQGLKYVVQFGLNPWESRVIIPKVLSLTYVQNSGAAFGVLADWTWLFVLVTFILLFALLFYFRKITALGKGFQFAIALEVGGALGNLVDRLRLGYVVDFVDFQVWPVFNLADMAIVSGAIIIAYKVLRFSNDSFLDKSGAGEN